MLEQHEDGPDRRMSAAQIFPEHGRTEDPRTADIMPE